MAAAMAIPAIASVVGGLLAGKKGKKNAGPQIPSQLLPFFNTALGLAQQGAAGIQLGQAPSSLTEGLPDITGQLQALLQPGTDRQFASGAADIREQNALTGNLSSSGVMSQLGDYRAQLGNAQMGQIANSYNAILPGLIAANAGLTQQSRQMPLDVAALGLGTGTGTNMYTPTYRQGPVNAIGQGLMAYGSSGASAGKGGGGKGGGKGSS